jgi:hypothetical protein
MLITARLKAIGIHTSSLPVGIPNGSVSACINLPAYQRCNLMTI